MSGDDQVNDTFDTGWEPTGSSFNEAEYEAVKAEAKRNGQNLYEVETDYELEEDGDEPDGDEPDDEDADNADDDETAGDPQYADPSAKPSQTKKQKIPAGDSGGGKPAGKAPAPQKRQGTAPGEAAGDAGGDEVADVPLKNEDAANQALADQQAVQGDNNLDADTPLKNEDAANQALADKRAAEDRAFEENPYGTGTDPDANQDYDVNAGGDSYGYDDDGGYDPEESPDATDVGYLPSDDFSNDFTRDDSADDYARPFDDDEEEDGALAPDGDDEDDPENLLDYMGRDAQDVEDAQSGLVFDRVKADEYNDVDAMDDKLRANKVDANAIKRSARAGDMSKKKAKKKLKKNAQKEQKLKKEKARRERQNRVINWEPGDPITLRVLDNIWKKLKNIPPVKPMLDAANVALSVLLMTAAAGDNLTFKLAKYIDTVMDENKTSDMIGTILGICSQLSRRVIYTSVSAVKAIFSQGWTEVFLLVSLPLMIDGLLTMQPLKGILQKIFTIAVPILNKASKLSQAGGVPLVEEEKARKKL